jgi:hypothetical protein
MFQFLSHCDDPKPDSLAEMDSDSMVLLGWYVANVRTIFSTASDSSVPTDAGIEPRTVATGALAVRRS